MKDAQDKLDKGSQVLWVLMTEANKAADEYCKAGDGDTSSKLRAVASHIGMAISVGRTINAGGVQPRFGDK